MELNLSQAKDVYSGRLCATVYDAGPNEGSSGSGGLRIIGNRTVDQLVLTCGAMLDYAIGVGPMRAFGPGAYDEQALTCALQAEGPGGVKFRTRVSVGWEAGRTNVPLFNGWITKHSHQLGWGEDSVITTFLSDLWLLGKITCGARATYDPQLNRYYWEFGKKPDLVFNAMGYPDCLDTPYGPMFAPMHRFGYRNDFKNWSVEETFEDTDEPAKGKATRTARSWTGEDGIRYFRNIHSRAAGASRPPLPVYIGNITLSDVLEWPEGLGAVFGSNRTLKGLPLYNNSLLDTLQAICRKMGPYDLACEPRGSGKSCLAIYDMNPKPNTGVTLYLPPYATGLGDCMNNPSVIKSAMVDEDAGGAFDNVCIVGNPPSVEDTFSTHISGTGAFGLTPAWTAEDERAFKFYISRYDNTLEAFQAACDKWPYVYAAYRISDGINPWEGTKWAGMKNQGRVKIKPFLNTGLNQDGSNPANWQPREIVVEYLYRYSDEYDDGTPPDPEEEWRAAKRYDNLTLSADQTIIFIDALRVDRQTWVSRNIASAPENGTYFGDHMRMRQVRLCAAVDANWPLTGVAGNGGAKEDDPNNMYERMAKPTKDIEFTWLAFAEDGDYVELLRKDSARPCGEANFVKIGDSRSYLGFPEKCTEGNELFTDRVNSTTGRLPDHAKARLSDVKRVTVEGTYEIETVAFGLRPGLSCKVDGGNSIRCEAVVKGVVFRTRPRSPREGQTSVIVGPPERQTIYDIPGGGRAIASDSSYQPSGSGGGDPYSEYDQKEKSGGDTPSTGSGSSTANTTDNNGTKVTSDNDSEANNQAIKSNPTAAKSENTSKSMEGESAKAPATTNSGADKPKPGSAASRAQNATAAADAARARGDDKAAARHEKNARKLSKKAENQAFKQAAKDSMPTTSVNGQVVNLENAFGKSLVGGGMTMPGGSKQITAGDLGKGKVEQQINGQKADFGQMQGAMFDTGNADSADKAAYTSRKEFENKRAADSIDRFSGTTRNKDGTQKTNVQRNKERDAGKVSADAAPAQPQRAQEALKQELGGGLNQKDSSAAKLQGMLNMSSTPKKAKVAEPDDE